MIHDHLTGHKCLEVLFISSGRLTRVPVLFVTSLIPHVTRESELAKPYYFIAEEDLEKTKSKLRREGG